MGLNLISRIKIRKYNKRNSKYSAEEDTEAPEGGSNWRLQKIA
jgi:hypothetical protein